MKILLLALLIHSFSAFAGETYSYSELDSYAAYAGVDLSWDEDFFKEEQSNPLMRGAPYKQPNTQSYFVPFEFDKNTMIKIAAASAVAVMFFANDEEIMNFAQDNKDSITERMAYVGEGLGSEWSAGAVGAGLIIGVVMKNHQITHVSLMAAKAALVAGLAVNGLKYSIQRARPDSSTNPYNFNREGAEHDLSFPSGHTAQAFAIATVIAEATKGQNKYIPILAYSAAALAGWSRMHDQKHWASDIVVGGLIGHLVAKSMMNSKMAKKGFLLVPHVGVQGDFAFNVIYTGKEGKLKCGEDLEGVEAFRDCMDKAFNNKRMNLF